jgi:hypothetical protein
LTRDSKKWTGRVYELSAIESMFCKIGRNVVSK